MPPKGGVPEEILNKVRNRETWDHFFIEKNPSATRHASHNTLGAELQILIQDLKPGTKANERALVIQRDLKVSNIFHDGECSTPYATGMGKKSVQSYVHQHYMCYWCRKKVSGLYITVCEHFALSWEMYPATTGQEKGKHFTAHFENPPPYSEQSHDNEDEEEPKSQTFPEYGIVEELTFDLSIATLLLPYRRILEEMQNHHVEEESQ
nr:9384_t:CDS:2 [Entrophospora candida]